MLSANSPAIKILDVGCGRRWLNQKALIAMRKVVWFGL